MNHLKWMGHQSTIYDIQKSLRNDAHSCEVTLVGRGKTVKAHRFVLSSCSDLLRQLLSDVPKGQECTIMVPDIKGSLLDSVLSFIYMGETCLNSNNLSEFLEAINHLGIKSAISFECNTGMVAPSSNAGLPDKSIGTLQMQADEIIEEEQIAPSPKMEEQTVIDGSDHQSSRDLEFLDVYNEPEQKITYSIEHMATASANEFILTESSGTFTLTPNTKLTDTGVADKVELEQIDEEADDNAHIMEEYSTTAVVSAEPIIEIANANEVQSSTSNSTHTTNVKAKLKLEKQQSQSINVLNDSQIRDESLELAVQGVLNEGMSLQKAAQKYHISKTVLWRRVRKHPMYMKTTRENPMLEAACNRLRNGESVKVISQALDIPMSTLHRHKVRLAQQGRLPDYISFKKRGSFSKEQLKEKLSKAVQACLHEGMSQNHAANMYEIPKSTLWRHLQKRMNDAQMQGLLDEEDAIKEEIILS